MIVFLHMFYLHVDGSNNPLGLSSVMDKVSFHVYFSIKDMLGFLIGLGWLGIVVFYYPNVFGHRDNSAVADPLVTPEHIQPE